MKSLYQAFRTPNLLKPLAMTTLALLTSIGSMAGNGKAPRSLQHQQQTAKPDGFNTPYRLHPASEYRERVLIFRVKEAFRERCQQDQVLISSLQSAISQLGGGKLARIYPRHEAPRQEVNKRGEKMVDLSLIYSLEYANNTAMEEACNLMLRSGVLQYAEPWFIHRTVLTPNDPAHTQQYHLTNIRAYQAWDITQGDTSVIVGVVDSGVDWDHPDMAANVALNHADPINSVDDDNDGYVDNYRGWDFAGANFNNIVGDNNPMSSGNNTSHGSHVSGISSAATNNRVGATGVGFNCKFMGIKCSADNDTRAGGQGFILNGYQGITYAADHGAQIINCSWGGGGFASQYEQDIIDYASVNKDALVVAACGNSNVADDFFPAYLDKVLSVASTTRQDVKSGFSNFSFKVSVSAPGSSIYAAMWNDRYQSQSGTSMASPVVAGVAALVKAQYPTFGYRELAATIRSTADNIYTISGNSSFIGRLGSGRVNAFRAVTVAGPSLRMVSNQAVDGNDNIFVSGDTISLRGTYINDLFASSSQLRMKLFSTNNSVSVLTDSIMIGTLARGATHNQVLPFKLVVQPGAPADFSVTLRLQYLDSNGYAANEYFSLAINQTYINIKKHNITTTIASNGRLGYSGDQATQGLGFQYKNVQTLFEMGTIAAVSADTVADCVRDDAQGYRKEFKSLQNVREVTMPAAGAYNVVNRFHDEYNGSRVVPGISVNQTTYVWMATPADSNYITVAYTLRNERNVTLRNLHYGIFSDFDISTNGANDIARWDSSLSLGYVFNSQPGGHYAGIALLSPYQKQFMPITNDGTNGGRFQIYDGFTLAEKYQSLSSGVMRNNIGAAAGQDVSIVAGYGPFTLAPGDSITLVFGLAAGPDLATLRAAVVGATGTNPITSLANNSTKTKQMLQLSPNPTTGLVRIAGLGAERATEQVWVQDAVGRTVRTSQVSTSEPMLDLTGMTPGVYTIKSQTGTAKLVLK